MLNRKFFAIMMIVAMMAGIFAGCSTNKSADNANNEIKEPTSNIKEPVKEEIVDIEVWNVNLGHKAIDKGSPLYNFYVDKLGVGVIHPYVEWNGGTDYLNLLNLKIAAGEMPDLFLPWNGNEAVLAKNGAIADLTDLLPKYAPNLWNLVPQEVWDVVKANDPTGQDRIYYVPGVQNYGVTGGLIRQDWLDAVGLPMPKTQAEYVDVLKAFRDKDPNGNKQADELPTGGREQARWMDHLFHMYGIAMVEGNPDWDIYDGELTYSAVTPNMKDALVFIASLYKDKLLDQETFLNNKATWDGKIDSNKAGNYFHWAEAVNEHLEKIEQSSGVKADLSVLPVLEVPGYKGFVTTKKIQSPRWVVKNNKDEKKLLASLKLLNNYANQEIWDDLNFAVEGMHYEVKDGKHVILPEDKSTQQNRFLKPFNDFGTIEFKERLIMSNASPDSMWMFEQNVRNMKENQKYVKSIAGDGMPMSVYEGYPDIPNRTLYAEYATKIILGVYPIEKFDEFVEKWNESGGEAVTQKARDWYANVKK